MPPGQPYQQPHGDQPGYPGPGLQQPLWQQPPAQPPAPKRGTGWKWGLGGVALLAVIGVTVAVTLTVVGKGDGGGSPTGNTQSVTAAANSDIASANDTGPVAVIVEEPTCVAQNGIFTALAAVTVDGWDKRDPAVPAAEWSSELRAQYEAAVPAIRGAADQMVVLARTTPHRVMRELYEQFIAYSRAYVERVPTYVPADDQLARTLSSAADALSRICSAITYQSAIARGPLVPALPTPSELAPIGDPTAPHRFLTESNSVCGDWLAMTTQYQNDTEAWAKTDPDVVGSQWTPEQRAINDDVAPVMRRFASQLTALGAQSGNPTLRDFADLAAQYRSAYVLALPSYTPADKYLAQASIRLVGVVYSACRAVET